ncbi:MAG TPA: DUF503 domain-containing protein [Clostridia bacterium]|jgi:uncharacterized protein YlxP (DUF503 family)|nr:DUF503 domain-containing protein [Clostridia bacterium]
MSRSRPREKKKTMLVGTCFLTLYINGSLSLKDKRRIVQGLCDRLRKRFHVCVSEIDYQDYWQKTGLGVAYLSNESSHIYRVLQQVINYVDCIAEVEIMDFFIEIL